MVEFVRPVTKHQNLLLVIRKSAQMQIDQSNIVHVVAKSFDLVKDFIT